MIEKFHEYYYRFRAIVCIGVLAGVISGYTIQKLYKWDQEYKHRNDWKLPANFCDNYEIEGYDLADLIEMNQAYDEMIIAHPIDIHLPTIEEYMEMMQEEYDRENPRVDIQELIKEAYEEVTGEEMEGEFV